MHSNFHNNLAESAGTCIVDTALCLESEGRGFESLQRIFLKYFLRQGKNITQNIITFMFLSLLFLFFFHHVHRIEVAIS